jgi:hypothetical protein
LLLLAAVAVETLPVVAAVLVDLEPQHHSQFLTLPHMQLLLEQVAREALMVVAHILRMDYLDLDQYFLL